MIRTALLAALISAAPPPPIAHKAKEPVTHASYFTPAEKGGQYYVLALINGHPLAMLVDTGADDVSVSEDAAAAMGLPDGGEIQKYVMADNSEETCRVVRSDIQVGAVHAEDVRVSVCKNASSLLGAAFIDKVKMTVVNRGLLFEQP